MNSGIEIAIDRGGTFCDFIAIIPNQEDYVFKLLSVDPQNYKDAPTEGIRRVLERAYNTIIPKHEKLKLDSIKSIRMGTTVATNALLERKGSDVCLLTTKGFKDVLSIGNQTRPNIFDLKAKKLDHLYKTVLEIDERVTIEGISESKNNDCQIDKNHDQTLVKGITGDLVRIIKKPNYDYIQQELEALFNRGEIKCIALSLLHSYVFPEHESEIAKICRKIGFEVSVSHELQPMIGMVNRTSSTVADAYLTPIIKEYLTSFGSGFEGGLDAFGNKLLFMQSNGGLCPWYKFTGLKAILSGPAGGMVGYGKTCFDSDSTKATIGFDAGGTSTDVSRFSGKLNHIFESVVSEVSLQTPQLDISTVAAGGGSMLFWKNGMFVVGPESAGSNPGPACYRKGGPLTVTDANLYLGRLLPEYFPKIFGPNQDEALDYDITVKKFEELTYIINQDKKSEGIKLTPEEVASGFLKIAIESMCRPIRALTEAKGFSTQDHNLACFGGSGGQFSVSLCKNLGISQVAIHKYSSLLSAYGIYLADILIEKQSPASWVFEERNFVELDNKVKDLVNQVYWDCSKQNLDRFSSKLEVYFNMKYVGTDTHLLIPKREGNYDCAAEFIERHQNEYGFVLDRKIIVDDVQVLLIIQRSECESSNPFGEYKELYTLGIADDPFETKMVYFEKHGWLQSSVYNLNDLNLKVGKVVDGPAIIIDETQTILIEPQSKAISLKEHILIKVDKEKENDISSRKVDPIQLSVFAHRFMSIAEQMGNTLQQTAISTNIKERLDFSCAVFDGNGDLVANAPHVPIHLGAMSFAVKSQINIWNGKLKQGDVLVSNHPIAGGSHLPDITVITPVLDENDKPIFWTASRGHHADIGSISAGSMPPNSKSIHQEGAAIVTHKLCVEGNFDEDGITRLLLEEPSTYPGCSGTRALSDNISDLKAQVAANYKGISLLNNLVDDFTYPVINLYMSAIQSTASESVRRLLKLTDKKFNGKKLYAVDYLDDGTPISVLISIDSDTGDAIFDFSNSGNEIYGNLNAPKAVLYSAILYVIRSLISEDIPLNNGCLAPIKVITKHGSLIDPSSEAAVVGGNVETSQRIVDVLLKAFGAVAASQGTCNNFTFGINNPENNVSFGYYETICGGSGAGPSWKGQNAVQCHTTNTRMTDVEIFEKRYPVILHEFSIRHGSGGVGEHNGGNGIIRDIEFTMANLEVSCLMERRSIAPFGLSGGGSGLRGENYWLRKLAKSHAHQKISIGGKCSLKVNSGDRIIIMTPGGGGFGNEKII
ncbi:uncharacterized protein AC631_01499 [Debaryomyces fabryi]|uniref:5-oxoprolinase n=1 Tax=Debaryomyces fabryi TaxID=58627 RepID=A0A0V1Q2E2_9ASCO|nr:uncharacterized protein AC631_01499 [Debaryomyces fabryi]KSA02699.1 hypothetical protein AC631_01499 [Debaryomyces fabryi]CUM56880.1 unnamed protein product [Debaryomyces fabryi]